MGRYDDEDTDVVVEDDTDDEAVDAAPRAPREEASAEVREAAKRVIKRGWGAAEQMRSADSPFAQRLKVDENEQLIKFLEDEPYTSFRVHWLERKGQKSFTCLSDIDTAGCPLCDAGDRPSLRVAFNVALISLDGDEPVVRSYEIGPRVIDQLKNFHTDPRTGPLSKHYWAIKRTGKGTTSATSLQVVRERDLNDDWSIDPLTQDQLNALSKQVYDASIVPIPARKTLLTIAAEELSD